MYLKWRISLNYIQTVHVPPVSE